MSMARSGSGTVILAVVICVILSPGLCESDVNKCTYGQNNYTLHIVVNKTKLEVVDAYRTVKTSTRNWWSSRTKYRSEKYTKYVQSIVPHKLEKTECCPGYAMDAVICKPIDDGCVNDTYGANCTQSCSCPENAFQMCEINTGNCTCQPGWKGVNCSEKCDTDACGSCICDNGAMCDNSTGLCVCQPGWEGYFCENACSSNKYGPLCSETCACNETQACDHIAGNCTTCQPGWTGPPLCDDECTDWTFGSGCRFNCSCDTQGSVNCSNIDGHCTCKPGYEGIFCENECPIGTYGDDCGFNCSDCETGLCDHVNGTCFCYGKQGPNCTDDCPVEHFGVDCSQECHCNESNSNDTCDPCIGACNCIDGWTGFTCDIACPVFVETCRSIRFFNECDPLIAKFECTAGWTGDDCSDVCTNNTYGQNCSSQCNCTDTQYCNPVTGECICLPGWTGESCDQACDEDTFGFNCSSQCKCSQQQHCNKTNGHCYCDPGFTGHRCKRVCDSSKYGIGCALKCNCTESSTCHHINGSCACVHGWDGDACVEASPLVSEDTTIPRYYIYIIAGVGAVIAIAVVIIVFIKRKGHRDREKYVEDYELQPVGSTISNDYSSTKRIDQLQGGQDNTVSVGFDEGLLQACPNDTHEQNEEVNSEINDDTESKSSNDNHRLEAENRESDIYVVKEVVVDDDDEKYYADVDNEPPNTQVPAVSDRVSKPEIDDEVEGDDAYDRCGAKAGTGVPHSDNTYNTFEEVRKADVSEQDDYDVVEQKGNNTKKKNFEDDYNTFAQMRKLSIKPNNASADSDDRNSDSYDNLEYQNKDKNKTCLKYDTDVYNKTETASRMSKESNKILSNIGKSFENNPLEELVDQEYDDPLFQDDKNKRVSEGMYEELPEDDISDITKKIESQTVNGNEVLKPVRNGTKPRLETPQSYENYDLPLVLGGASVKESGIPSVNKKNGQAMKSKDRKNVDYEEFKLKF